MKEFKIRFNEETVRKLKDIYSVDDSEKAIELLIKAGLHSLKLSTVDSVDVTRTI